KLAISGANTMAATAMTKVDSTHYTGTHLVGAGDGTATVALSIGTDLAGNLVTSAPTSRATFTVDNTPPTVSIVGPSATPTRSGPVTYTVGYTGANAVTLSATGITLNTTGTASAFVAVSGTGITSRTVTLSSITGDGTLSLSIAAGSATDTAGNSAGAAGPSGTLVGDNTAPGLALGMAPADGVLDTAATM